MPSVRHRLSTHLGAGKVLHGAILPRPRPPLHSPFLYQEESGRVHPITFDIEGTGSPLSEQLLGADR
jgi:hypothetical protein